MQLQDEQLVDINAAVRKLHHFEPTLPWEDEANYVLPLWVPVAVG